MPSQNETDEFEGLIDQLTRREREKGHMRSQTMAHFDLEMS